MQTLMIKYNGRLRRQTPDVAIHCSRFLKHDHRNAALAYVLAEIVHYDSCSSVIELQQSQRYDTQWRKSTLAALATGSRCNTQFGQCCRTRLYVHSARNGRTHGLSCDNHPPHDRKRTFRGCKEQVMQLDSLSEPFYMHTLSGRPSVDTRGRSVYGSITPFLNYSKDIGSPKQFNQCIGTDEVHFLGH